MSKSKGRRSLEVLTPAEVVALIKECSTRYPTGRRNRALLTLLYRSGIRINEALDLMPKDLDLHAGTIVVLHGKGDRRRVLGLDQAAQAAMRSWERTRSTLGLGKKAPLFCTMKGSRIDSSYIRQLLPRLAKKAGIEKRVHAHGLRHTLAAEMAQEGVPMHVLQQVLGHTSLRTTSRYVDHLLPTEVIAAMQRRDWDERQRRRRNRKQAGGAPGTARGESPGGEGSAADRESRETPAAPPAGGDKHD